MTTQNQPNSLLTEGTTIMDSMRRDGWNGPAIIVDGTPDNWIVDGNHRYAVAKELGYDDSEIPMVDIRDLFDEAGMDYDDLIADMVGENPDENDLIHAQNDAIMSLPGEIQIAYGLFEGQ